MTAPASGIFKETFGVAMETTPLGWETDDWQFALIRDAITGTFDYNTDTAYGVSPWNSGEVSSGGGYTTGGFNVAGRVRTVAAGRIILRHDDLQLGPSLTLAQPFRGGLYHNNTLSPKIALCFVNFGVDTAITDPQIVTIQLSGTPLDSPGSLLSFGI